MYPLWYFNIISELKLQRNNILNVYLFTFQKKDELRKSIVEEVKQSLVLNDDISDKIKIRDLSDALYQELGYILLVLSLFLSLPLS